VQVRDGPAAVRGVALRRDATGRNGWEGGGGGAPSQKTCRPPRTHRTPRGRRIRVQAHPRTPRSSHAVSAGRGRLVGLGDCRAPADRLALADRDRVAVRDRRRQAGRRGRRPVGLPEAGTAHDALRLHAERRGDRRVQARPRRRLLRPERPRRHPARARGPRARPGCRENARRCLRADPAARGAHGPRRGGGGPRRADEAADRSTSSGPISTR
jgi:hypothetical protein